MKGRKPLPKRVKIIRGTFRSYRDDLEHPDPPRFEKAPRPPAGMTRWARAKWRELAPELAEQGLLTTLDLTTLRVAVEAYALYIEAREAVYSTIDPKTGRRKKRTLRQYLEGRNSQTSPELATMRSAERAFRSYLSEFGLSPSTRQRIAAGPKKKPRSAMRELLEGR